MSHWIIKTNAIWLIDSSYSPLYIAMGFTYSKCMLLMYWRRVYHAFYILLMMEADVHFGNSLWCLIHKRKQQSSYIPVSSANNRLKCLIVRVGAICLGGYSIFFFVRRLRPSIYCLPIKISGKSSTPNKYLIFLQPQTYPAAPIYPHFPLYLKHRPWMT